MTDTTPQAALLPCPFCGRPAEHVSRADNHSETGRTFIVSCFCGGYSACAHQQEDTLEEVVTSWNTRAKLQAATPASGEVVYRRRTNAQALDCANRLNRSFPPSPLKDEAADHIRELVAVLTTPTATPAEPAQAESAKLFCGTCEGTGKVHQEHQAGCWVGGEFECPDCDGNGYIVSTTYTIVPPASQPQALSTWQSIETAPENMTEIVVVRWQDSEGNEQHDFDYTEDGCWIKWHEYAEHVEMIGGHGVSYTPPYTHWMPLPPPPSINGLEVKP